MRQPVPNWVKKHHISVLDWWEKVLDGKIYVPMGNNVINKTESKYNRIIQKIDPQTNEIVAEYDTVKEAIGKISDYNFTLALDNGREYDGYYYQWAYELKNEPKVKKKKIKEKKGNHNNGGVAVCKIDPKTGKVVETYQSIIEVSRATGYSAPNLKYAMMHGLERDGYIYVRQDGKTKPKVATVRFVKIDPKTGEVIGKYKSVSEALRSMGITNRLAIKEAATSGKPYKGYIWKRNVNK